jgi:adenylate kinase family enzyme
VVGGGSGAGKTTIARALAVRMGVPVIELDSLFHGPNWTPTPTEVFRQRILAATSDDAWVIDGNYSVVRDVTWGRADTLVWLDPSITTVLRRVFKRTNRRIQRREELWNGNRETFRNAYLSLDSLYVWILRSHWRRRRTWPRILARPEYRHLEVHRFRTPAEAARWLAETSAVIRG